MNADKRDAFDRLIRRLWAIESAPKTKDLLDLLRTIDFEDRPTIIRLIMSRCMPRSSDILELLNEYPENGSLILQWVAYHKNSVEELLFFLKESTHPSVKEGLGLMVLGHPNSGCDQYIAVAKESGALQEHVWHLYQKVPATEGKHRIFVTLSEYAPLLRERIARYFLGCEYYLPGLLIGLTIPSCAEQAVEKILAKDSSDGCLEVLGVIDPSSKLARRACYLLLRYGKNSVVMMLAVMKASRIWHDHDSLTARNRFVELVSQSEHQNLIPYIREALEILEPEGDPCRDIAIHSLREILKRLESTFLTDAQMILRSLKGLSQQGS